MLKKQNWPRTAMLLKRLLRPAVWEAYHASLLVHRKYLVSTVHAAFGIGTSHHNATSAAFGAALVAEMAERTARGVCRPSGKGGVIDRGARCADGALEPTNLVNGIWVSEWGPRSLVSAHMCINSPTDTHRDHQSNH